MEVLDIRNLEFCLNKNWLKIGDYSYLPNVVFGCLVESQKVTLNSSNELTVWAKLVSPKHIQLVGLENSASLFFPNLPDDVIFGVVNVDRGVIEAYHELFVAWKRDISDTLVRKRMKQFEWWSPIKLETFFVVKYEVSPVLWPFRLWVTWKYFLFDEFIKFQI